MTLVTRCPACGTSFRVTEPQLQARGGMVRCGTCLATFNGREALIAPPAPPAGAGGEPIAPEAPAPAPEPAESAPAVAAVPAQAPESQPEPDRGFEPGLADFDDGLDAEPPRPPARGWAAATLLMGLVLAAQAVYAYRGELASRYPALRPHLVALCAELGCAIVPPQRPRQIAIEASDLQAVDRLRPGLIQLTVTLRNHAPHDLGFPAIDLVLTNTKEHTLARRIFTPREYLGGTRDLAEGIPASAEITVRLELDTGDLNPAGFRLDLLAAPDEL